MNRGWIWRWIFNIVMIIITASVIQGFNVTITGAIFGSIILGIVNAIIRPIVIFITLPINIITLGLFTLVINALMLWLTSSVVMGFELVGFGAAFISALVISILSFFVSFIVKD